MAFPVTELTDKQFDVFTSYIKHGLYVNELGRHHHENGKYVGVHAVVHSADYRICVEMYVTDEGRVVGFR